MSTIKLSQILLEKGYVTPDQLREAKRIQQSDPTKSLPEVLIGMNITSEANILSALAERWGAPFIETALYISDTDVIKLVPEKIARKHHVIPYKMDHNRLIVAMRDPSNIEIIEDIKMVSCKEVGYVIATYKAIDEAIEKYYANISAQRISSDAEQEVKSTDEVEQGAMSDIDNRVDNSPIVKLLNTLVQQAYLKKASDIHVEPFKDIVLIRMRIDGDLQEYIRITPAAHKNLITRIKILANMNIAEKRIPLDGRFEYSFEGLTVDIRVSTLPTTYGEKAVLRLLGTALGKDISLADLGMTPPNVKKFTRICKAPNGVILVTGPTGSGKSTTLYTVLNDLNKPTVNITTIEDPVEKHLFGLNQVQINTKAGLTFASGLRSILRQDPDVIMIGEIRDYETAEITMRAAITGHLVLSTLHTNSAVKTVSRLIDMGVAPYLVAAAVNGIMAQRLVKLLCPKCKKLEPATELQRRIVKDPSLESSYVAVGCPSCGYTGYSGRTAVHEVLELDNDVREMITLSKSDEEIRKYAEQTGMVFMDQNVLQMVKEGRTSIDEYTRIIYVSV